MTSPSSVPSGGPSASPSSPAAPHVRLRQDSALLKTTRTIVALMLREMGSTYGRSPGGYIWAILEPIGVILVLSVAFSLLVRTPSLGNNFILFYATGYMAFALYSDLAQSVQSALRYSRPLLAYPGVTWLDAVLARFALNLITGATVMALLFSGLLAVVNTPTILDIGPILTAIAMICCLSLGVGLINCVLIGLYPVWGQVWGIMNRPLFLASAVLFIYEDMPRVVQDILWWNPLIHVTGLFRTGFYSTYHATYISLPYCFGVGLGLTALGLIFLRAHYKRVLET